MQDLCERGDALSLEESVMKDEGIGYQRPACKINQDTARKGMANVYTYI